MIMEYLTERQVEILECLRVKSTSSGKEPALPAPRQRGRVHFAGPNSGRDADTIRHRCGSFRPGGRRNSDAAARTYPLVQFWTGYATAAVRMRVMSVVFSSLHQGVVVSRNPDGSYSWSGQYNGAAIKSAVPIDDGKHCILLLDPDASKRSAYENLLCIDRKGSPVWTAKLPTSPDVFLEVTLTPEGLFAKTWSGLKVLLDQHTGAELKRIFVK
jgi:hypothetical protein